PWGDTDGNTCTTAGCELNTAGVGVCVQTDLVASNSTPGAGSDGNACTTAGCNGAGTCDQNHSVQVCTTDQCNKGCDTSTGQCTENRRATRRGNTDGNAGRTAGGEENTAGVGVGGQSHQVEGESRSCADSGG